MVGERCQSVPRVFVGLAAILLLAGPACRGDRPAALPSPVGFDAGSIQVQLENRVSILPAPEAHVASLVIVFPEAGDDNPTVTIDPIPGGSVSTLGLLGNTGQALDEPGVYVAVLTADGFPIFLSRVSDPTISRGEGLSLDANDRGRGILVSEASTTAGGSLGLRIPFVRNAIVEVFRVREGAGGQNKVDSPPLLVTGFPRGDIPSVGWSFEVER